MSMIKERLYNNTRTTSLCQYNAIVSGILAALVYLQTINYPFLHDDIPAILKNPDVQGETPFPEIFNNDFWGTPVRSDESHKSYRPVTVAILRLLNYFFGNWSLPYHVMNIILHAVVTALFTKVCEKLVFGHVPGHASLVCGILFAVHPIHTEAVCGVVGCAELLSALLFMSTLLLHNQCEPSIGSFDVQSNSEWRNTDRKNSAYHSEATVPLIPNNYHSRLIGIRESFVIPSTATFAMLSKESGISVLGVVIILESLQYSDKNTKYNLKRFCIRCFIYIIWVLMLLIFRMWVMGWKAPVFAEPDNPASFSQDWTTRFLTYCYLCAVNCALLLCPAYLCYDWSYDTIPLVTSYTDPRNLASLFLFSFLTLLVVHIGCMLWKAKYKNHDLQVLVIGTAMLIVPFLPASNLFFPVGFVVAERVAYLPSAGFIILVGFGWWKVSQQYPKLKTIMEISLIFLIVSYFARTVARNEDWRSKEAFFLSGLRSNPHNAKIRYNWANYLRDNHRPLAAATEYEKVLELYPEYVGAMNNLATILEESPATRQRAEELYVRVIQMQPWHENAYNNFANLLVKRSKYEEAVNVLLRGIHSSVNHVTHSGNLARILTKRGKVEQAERIYEHIVDQFCSKQPKVLCRPKISRILQDYGAFLEQKGNRKRSLQMYRLAHQANISNTESMAKFANALALSGRVEQATQLITYAVKIDKERVVDMWRIAASLFKSNKLVESKRFYEIAASLQPENLELVGQYAAVLSSMGQYSDALMLLTNLTVKDPGCNSEGAWRNLASILGRQGDHKKAISILSRCLESTSSAAMNEVFTKKAMLMCEIAKHKRDLAKSAQRQNNKQQMERLLEEAIKHLKEGMRMNPENKECKTTLERMGKEHLR